jgi:hypothetical protein
MRLHTRTIIRDRMQAFVGSQSLREMELTARREVGVIFRDPKMIGQLMKTFAEDWEAVAPPLSERADQPPAIEPAKVAKKVAKAVAKELPPVAPVVEVIVKEMVGDKGQGEINHHKVEEAIKEAVKDAIRDVVEVVVEQNGHHRADVEP